MRIYIQYDEPGTKTELFRAIEQQGAARIMNGFKELITSALKPLETEIESEGGAIVIKEDGTVELRGFSEDLELRIKPLLFNALNS
jgi:hypothetical protein